MSNEETSAELRKLTVRGLSPKTLAALKGLATNAGQPLETFVREELEVIASRPIVKQYYLLRAWSTESSLGGIFIRRDKNGVFFETTPHLSEKQREAYEGAVDYVKLNGPGDRERAIGLLALHFEDYYEKPLAKEQYSIQFGNADGKEGGIIHRIPCLPGSLVHGITAMFYAEGEALRAVEKAEAFIRRNGGGDAERAVQILEGFFDHVYEVPKDSSVVS